MSPYLLPGTVADDRARNGQNQNQEKVPMILLAICSRLPPLDSRWSRLRLTAVCVFAAGAPQWL